MNDERVNEEIVTMFLFNTCRPRPRLSLSAAQAIIEHCQAASKPPDDDLKTHWIPLTTGSAAEFYIEPMYLPHIGDIDVMLHHSILLAIPQGHPPPTELPVEFHNYVQVYEIIDSHLPGYVYLPLRYLLTVCSDDNTYKAVQYDEVAHLSNRFSHGNNDTHGPAVVNIRLIGLPCDIVRCVRCLVWPSQAGDWPTRRRNYGWPDSATADDVVSNGCDVVGVAHRKCREDIWKDKHQYRLSFSRAEIVLLNSWMPVQQIIYHMLRVFVKTERLTESVDKSKAGALSNYHIKTLMLWQCERKSRIWWTDDLSLVRICVELLHELAHC